MVVKSHASGLEQRIFFFFFFFFYRSECLSYPNQLNYHNQGEIAKLTEHGNLKDDTMKSTPSDNMISFLKCRHATLRVLR